MYINSDFVEPCPFCGAMLRKDEHEIQFGIYAGQSFISYYHPKDQGCILDGMEVPIPDLKLWNKRTPAAAVLPGGA